MLYPKCCYIQVGDGGMVGQQQSQQQVVIGSSTVPVRQVAHVTPRLNPTTSTTSLISVNPQRVVTTGAVSDTPQLQQIITQQQPQQQQVRMLF